MHFLLDKHNAKIDVRLPVDVKESLHKDADEKGVTASELVKRCVQHRRKIIEPKTVVYLQNIANGFSNKFGDTEPELCAELQSEVNKLWQKLK